MNSLNKIKIILLCILLVAACGRKKPRSNKDRPFIEYQYPLDSLRTPRCFIFERVDSPQIKSNRIQMITSRDNEELVIKYTLNSGRGGNRDSSVYIIESGFTTLIESYAIASKGTGSSTSKGKVVKVSDDSYHYVSEIDYPDPFNESIVSTLISTSDFVDTLSYTYQGQEIPAIRYKEKLKITTIQDGNPLLTDKMELVGESILAKNIGLVYYSAKSSYSGKTFAWRLDTIVSYPVISQ